MFNIEFTGEFAAFFVFSAIMICGAVLMVSLQKVVHMVISMAGVFLGLAGMFVLLEAEFVAFVQVLIYAGAVSILMIFGIMMTNHRDANPEPLKPLHEVLVAVGTLCLFGVLFYAIRVTDFPETTSFSGGVDNTLNIGQLLYTGYIVPFELLSVLLTVAFIGAIVIARRPNSETIDGFHDSNLNAKSEPNSNSNENENASNEVISQDNLKEAE